LTLYVQPAELARKLVKEMEDHKVSRAAQVSVRNRYTIFLCEEDFDRLYPQRDSLIPKLERHLEKHIRSKHYQAPGEISVDLVPDPDLKLGYFGILGEREAPGFAEQQLPGRFGEEPPGEELWPVASDAEMRPPARQARRAQEPASPTRPLRVVPQEPMAPTVFPAPAPAASPAAAQTPSAAQAERPGRSRPSEGEQGGATRVIAPADAAELGLARETIVIRSGNRVREFSQGRVIIGRAREADFRIDNPDVSRRHAALYWSNGKIVLEDLGSTNGTMVNGYPISNTVISPNDVVVIGDCRMNVDAR
jgi:hypothetical protein